MTHNAAMGLIAARDFVDLVVNISNDEFVGTLGMCLYNTLVKKLKHSNSFSNKMLCGVYCKLPNCLHCAEV